MSFIDDMRREREREEAARLEAFNAEQEGLFNKRLLEGRYVREDAKRYREALAYYEQTGLEKTLRELADEINGTLHGKEDFDDPANVVRRVTWKGVTCTSRTHPEPAIALDKGKHLSQALTYARALEVITNSEGTVQIPNGGLLFNANIEARDWKNKLRIGQKPFDRALKRAYSRESYIHVYVYSRYVSEPDYNN